MTEKEHPLNERQAAEYIGASVFALRSWRSSKKGPTFFRAGKLVRYRRGDLDAWIESRLVTPATEPANAER